MWALKHEFAVINILLVGDYEQAVVAHQAIPRAIDLAAQSLAAKVEKIWIRTAELNPQSIPEFDALWCVPFSPYEKPEVVIAVIKIARENDIPFLGTCAGYQHAVIEYARNVLGFESAASIEDDPDTQMPVIAPLACKLCDQAEAINIERDSRAGDIYQAERVLEEYHCGFGVNRDFEHIFENSQLRFSGHDDNGDPRVCEIPDHRFFIGTAYQPERSALKQTVHPLITAFLTAAL
jgi:CTP synthase (UTP-ammonia lyase)